MADWGKIIAALLIGAMLVFLIPRAGRMMKESPKGSTQDWQAFLITIVIVAAFIWVLTQLV